MFKYAVISGPYFAVSSPNTGKYGPEIIPCLDTFHGVKGNFLSQENMSFIFETFSET